MDFLTVITDKLDAIDGDMEISNLIRTKLGFTIGSISSDVSKLVFHKLESSSTCDPVLAVKESRMQEEKASNVVVSGLKLSDEVDDDLECLISLGKEIKADINPAKIVSLHRYDSKMGKKLVVKFKTQEDKKNFYSKRVNLKNHPSLKKVFINHDLTKAQRNIEFHNRVLKKNGLLSSSSSSSPSNMRLSAKLLNTKSPNLVTSQNNVKR